jgi:hypothetical protein
MDYRAFQQPVLTVTWTPLYRKDVFLIKGDKTSLEGPKAQPLPAFSSPIFSRNLGKQTSVVWTLTIKHASNRKLHPRAASRQYFKATWESPLQTLRPLNVIKFLKLHFALDPDHTSLANTTHNVSIANSAGK